MWKKILNFWVLANIKVAPAKIFNFGFYSKPSLLLLCHQKIRKMLSKLSTNQWDTLYVYSRLITVNMFSVTNLGQIVLGCAWACTLRPLRVTSKERWLMCSSFPILHHIKERHFRRRPATEANYRLHISWVSEFAIWKSHSLYNWSIKARGHAFSSSSRACDLCLTEKLIILTADQSTMLNRRDELLETCRHQRKHLLVSLFLPKKKEPPDTSIK